MTLADMSDPTSTPHWALMPFIDNVAMTLQAVEDLLAQTVPVRVLLMDQGSSEESRRAIDRYIEQRGDVQVLCCHYLPALPSLSAVWNTGLNMLWDLGQTEVLVPNNDILCWPHTVEVLLAAQRATGALFISAVGVREPQYREWLATDPPPTVDTSARGGPDYSFFLITKEGHQKYPFDERFIPAFFEDLDSHRRYMLGGDGQRIFSVNIPYLHYASQTIKAYTPEVRSAFNKAYARNQEYYARKWGGLVNAERFVSPFGACEPPHGAAYTATPDLQRRCLAGLHPYGDTQSIPDGADGLHSGAPETPGGDSAGIVPAL